VRDFIEQTGVTFPVGWDDNGSYRRFRPPSGISPFPLDVVIDREGRIVYLSGEFDSEAMQRAVEQVLAEQP